MIEQIKTLEQVGTYLPYLVKAYRENRSLFEDNMSETDFISRVFTHFKDESNLFFGRIANDRLEFFVCTADLGYPKKDIKLVWFCYCDPHCHRYTYPWIDLCKEYCKTRGIKELRFITNRLTRAYRRFANRIGGKVFLHSYKINLNNG